MEKIFSKNIADSRQNKIEFLTKHFRYYTANSWNRLTSYANNVKINNLKLPEEIKNKAYDFICAECDDFWFDVREMISDFRIRTGYSAGFNGRSDGYIVLYDDNSCRSIDQYEDFEDWDDSAIDERVQLVKDFDELCDNIRDLFIDYVKNSEICEEEYTVVKKRIIAKRTDEKELA